MMPPTLSIVVAVWWRPDSLEECLRALSPQIKAGVEVLVVTSAVTEFLEKQYSQFRWLRAPKSWLVPQLWGMGMAAARCDTVAITTAQFIPSPDWVHQIREAFAQSDATGIGGPIDPPRGQSLVDWAIYFQRYSTYLGWETPRASSDLPGDNAAYRRSALLRHPEFFDEGFWEPEFHRLVFADGGTLTWHPAMRVRQGGGFGFWRFIRQRFCHAMRFGRSRAVGRGLLYRLAGAGLSPLIPLIFGGKIVKRVLRARRDVGRFWAASPLLVCFLLTWAVGEALGYLWPPSKAEQSLFEGKGLSA
jgi:hypothetical protein